MAFGSIGLYIGKAYDALTGKHRRRTLRIDTRSEDRLLQPLDRQQLVSNARNLQRNAAIAAWMMRKHLDYVSTFRFQCRIPGDTPDIQALNRKIEDLIDWWARPQNIDVSGRFSLQQLTRLNEQLAFREGDCFTQKMSDGRIQLIEGDRVLNATDLGEYTADDYDWDTFVHGVQVTASGKALRYAVCDRMGAMSGFVLNTVIPAQYILHHAYRDRYDQIRGVSPLSSAMNTFFDLYEAQEFALAKMKLSQLFALKYKHAGTTDVATQTDSNGNAIEEPQKFDFGSGPQLLELDPDDDAEFLESNTPSTEFQQFMEKGISIALKSADLPYSFYDESFTNYSGARQALLMYEQSCESKRANLKQWLTNLTVWRLQLFIADGELVLPDGFVMDDVDFEWIPAALPWIDPLKEVSANVMAVSNGFASRQQICKESGLDWFKVMDEQAQEKAYMESKGLTIGDAASNLALANAIAVGSQDQQPAGNQKNGGKSK